MSIVSVIKIVSTISSDNLSSAFEENIPCVAATVTDSAPFYLATLAAFDIVPAVSIISSIINICLFASSPTTDTTSD